MPRRTVRFWCHQGIAGPEPGVRCPQSWNFRPTETTSRPPLCSRQKSGTAADLANPDRATAWRLPGPGGRSVTAAPVGGQSGPRPELHHDPGFSPPCPLPAVGELGL